VKSLADNAPGPVHSSLSPRIKAFLIRSLGHYCVIEVQIKNHLIQGLEHSTNMKVLQLSITLQRNAMQYNAPIMKIEKTAYK
jgi:hypothetical protein